MLFTLIIPLCLAIPLFIQFLYGKKNERDGYLYFSFLVFGATSFGGGLSTKISTNSIITIHQYSVNIDLAIKLLLIIFSIALFFVMRKVNSNNKNEDGNIYAKRQMFWDVDSEDTLSLRKDGIVQVGKAQEYDIQDFDKFFKWNSVEDFRYLTEIARRRILNCKEFIFIDDLLYFENEDTPKPLKIVFKRLKELNIDNNNNLNFDEYLKNNNYVMQFFLLDIWEELTKRINLSITSFWTIIDIEDNPVVSNLFGAIMSVEESTIKPFGYEIYAHYLLFKRKSKNA